MPSDSEKPSLSYRDAGVDLQSAADVVERYRKEVAATRIPGVVADIGGFGGLFSLKDAGVDLEDPILVSATDGVGTKLKLAFELGVHHTIGQDCVAMCVNDVVTTGARPLFFLDYLATGRLDPAQAAAIVAGIARACTESGCALIGGETAEMPGFYGDGEYDVAGFCVGVMSRSAAIDPRNVRMGDALIGVASSGFHSNGYSLVRKIVDTAGLDLSACFEGPDGWTLGLELLRPTVLYPRAAAALTSAVPVHALCHVTGGGFYENLPRVLPPGVGAYLDPALWARPRVIDLVCDAGNVAPRERYSVFNMGLGLIAAVAPEHVDASLAALDAAGATAWLVGEVAGTEVTIAGVD